MKVHDLLNKMESAEETFLQTEFLSPVMPGGQVRVRIAGVVCTLGVEGAAEPGWAILRPLSLNAAQVVGQPTLRQIRDYLELFPQIKMILLARKDRDWLALHAHKGDRRFQLDGPARVRLAEGVEPFQQIVARYDGAQFWFQEVDRRRSPAIAAYLRECMNAETPPSNLRKPTLTAEERAAYAIAYEGTAKARAAARRSREEARLSDALTHAGAELVSFMEQRGVYTVNFRMGQRQHRTIVRRDDLTVLAAGICLSGQDQRFDLQSLVGVIREGAQRGRLVEEGIHPEGDW
jgi:hypothetical protein